MAYILKSLDKIVEIEDGLLKPILKGDDIHRYSNLKNRYFVIFPYLIENKKAEPMSEEFIKENFPKGYKYLKENEIALRGREKGRIGIRRFGSLYILSQKFKSNFETGQKFITPDYRLFNISNWRFLINWEISIIGNNSLTVFIKKDNIYFRLYYFLSIF